MISDSIAKYVDNVDGLTVKSYRGACISDMENYIKRENLQLYTYDYIILHVGTNDIRNRSVKQIMQAYKFLFRACKSAAGNATVVFSSILPRLVDFEETKGACINVNSRLEEFCRKNGLIFVKSYKRFLHAGQPISNLFAKRDGGLHLSFEGTKQLRQCIIHIFVIFSHVCNVLFLSLCIVIFW